MQALQSAGLSLLLSSTVTFAEAADGDLQARTRLPANAATQPAFGVQGHPLRTDSRLSDILTHPAFAGFARHLLPWDDRAYDGEMRLSNLSTLLPYHSHVDPDGVVNALNRMIADANQGKKLFFDVYTEAQKRSDPSKEHTGLFFLRGKPGAPFAIIAPGGGFAYVGSVHEGFPYAVDINKLGYHAFVLKYRTGSGGEVATQDLAAAISYIFDNPVSLGVGTQDYSVWGSSAGARMAAAIGSHGTAAFGGKALPKPASVVLAYTGHSDYSSNEPPTFVVVGEHDGIAPPAIMKRRVAVLKAAGTPVVYRQYRGLGHGFGLGAGTSAEGWVRDATHFWEGFIRLR